MSVERYIRRNACIAGAYLDNLESFFELIDAARNEDNVGALEGQHLRG